MNLKSLSIIGILPFTIWANTASPVANGAIETPKDETVQAAENPAEDSNPLTESEFTGNESIDAADAGNIVDSAATDSAAEAQIEAANAQKVAEDIKANSGNDESGAEVAEAESDADGANSEETAQSQEDAEAELAADMGANADSTSADSVLQSMELDMKAAVIPTYSRRVASPYGIRTYRMHRGVDLGLCQGEDRTIVAAFPGKVKLVRNQGRRRGYGKYVIIDHGNGLTTLYAHLASWNVKIGDELQAGDTVGVGGNTGRSFGAHLHFEIKYKGIYIDPTTVFNFQDSTYINEVAVLDPAALQAVEDEYQKELAKHRYYKVRRGDCLGKIARRYGISVRRLKQLNGLRSNFIRPGQVLKCS